MGRIVCTFILVKIIFVFFFELFIFVLLIEFFACDVRVSKIGPFIEGVSAFIDFSLNFVRSIFQR